MLSSNKSYKNRKVSLTIPCKYKYFDSTVQRAEDRRQKFHFCRLPVYTPTFQKVQVYSKQIKVASKISIESGACEGRRKQRTTLIYFTMQYGIISNRSLDLIMMEKWPNSQNIWILIKIKDSLLLSCWHVNRQQS